ncbi:hypothetical protein STRAU_1691 [Streptomyces aurantiacus JA 4570]|uniref:Uncharacterized protein n=1 Tax=Streptomyces aurantiacus JA 4570 TaxID=1286094 RepID=S4A3D0_9ACTN|nr:hypothetical protein STRAU_1691 [Streptomyces aurantiacus JA 4570]
MRGTLLMHAMHAMHAKTAPAATAGKGHHAR